MKNITYTERNGIRYPNLTLPEQTNYPLGKYAILSLDFMKKHIPNYVHQVQTNNQTHKSHDVANKSTRYPIPYSQEK